MDSKKLSPATFFGGLLLGGGIIVAIIYYGTHSSLSSYIHLPTSNSPTAQQLAAAQAAKQQKIAACQKTVTAQWGTAINLAKSENLPTATYEAQEQQLLAKCQSQ